MQTENNPIIKLEIDEAGISDFCGNEDFSAQTIEVEILPPVDINDQREIEIYNGIDEIDEKLSVLSARVDELNSELDCLTNHADGIDYTIAVASGVITGLIDAFLIGEFDFEGSRETVDKKFKELVKKKVIAIEEGEKEQRINKAIKEYKEKAAKEGKPISDEKIEKIKKSINESYEKKHDVDAQLQKAIEKAKAKNEPIDIEKLRKKVEDNELSKAIAKLEEVFGLPSDSSYGAGDGISAKSHHLDDLAHHPTIIGWAASMVTQFTGNAYFQNKEGKNLKYKVKKVRVIDNVNAYIIYGNSIETTRITAKGNEKPALEVTLIGDDLKSKFACGTFNWLGHLLSDMAGSSSSAKKGNPGMGLPGPIMSLLKEISMLPIIKKTPLPQLLDRLFTKDNILFEKYRLDLRSELAIGRELGKQSVPVFLNTLLVRTFFFMRRFIEEAKAANSIRDVNWRKTLPFKNRTVTRMLTIATGTFTAVDVADAAIRSGGFNAACILRINFVGIGRFAIAVGSDVHMGIKKGNRENERMLLCGERLELLNAKLFYKEADMWIEAVNTEQALQEVVVVMDRTASEFFDTWEEVKNSSIGEYAEKIRNNDPDFAEELLDILEWGV